MLWMCSSCSGLYQAFGENVLPGESEICGVLSEVTVSWLNVSLSLRGCFQKLTCWPLSSSSSGGIPLDSK